MTQNKLDAGRYSPCSTNVLITTVIPEADFHAKNTKLAQYGKMPHFTFPII